MATPARSVAATATLAGRSADSLSRRSLFVRVRPPPVTLSERRAVLRVLERYGKTDMFKKMGDNASFIIIAESTAMAETLILRSPMQYEYMAETFQASRPWGNPPVATVVAPVETTGTAAAAADTSSSSSSSTSSRQTSQIAQKSFTLSVFLSQDYHHRNTIRNSPLHGPWPEDGGGSSSGSRRRSGAAVLVRGNSDTFGSLSSDKHTYIYNALQDVVPESSSSDALCDWRPRGNAVSTEMTAAAHNVSSVVHRTTTTTTTAAEAETTTGDDVGDGAQASESSSSPSSPARTRTPKSPVAAASALMHIRQRQLRRTLSNQSPILEMLARASGAQDDNDKDDNNNDSNGQGG